MAMEQGRQLYLFMLEKGFNTCMYRIGESLGDSSDEASIRLFDAPLLTMDKPIFPAFPSFTAIGSRIFMIGGYSEHCSSNKVFIYDTSSSTLVPGPDLNAAKDEPYLFTFGSKILALSRRIYVSEEPSARETNPRFEMLDTDDDESKWTPLPNPMLLVSSNDQTSYTLSGTAAVLVNNGSPVIFISVYDAGTYCFEVDNLVWYYLGTELLPIYENAVTIPYVPSMCFGHSLKAFHFCYEGNGKGFKVNEIRVDDYKNLPSLGEPPALMCQRPLPVVFGPDNHAYFIHGGVDEDETSCSPPGNRYVKVYALDFEGINLDLNRHDEDQDETIITKISLSRRWGECFFGGPAVLYTLNVISAIAM